MDIKKRHELFPFIKFLGMLIEPIRKNINNYMNDLPIDPDSLLCDMEYLLYIIICYFDLQVLKTKNKKLIKSISRIEIFPLQTIKIYDDFVPLLLQCSDNNVLMIIELLDKFTTYINYINIDEINKFIEDKKNIHNFYLLNYITINKIYLLI